VPARHPVAGPTVWHNVDVVATRSWEAELDEHERRVIVDAAERAREHGHDALTVTRDAFALPGLELRLGEWAHALSRGRGFLLIHGFPVDLLDAAATELAYVGLGTHLGRPVGQNAAGDRLTHIRDERLPPGPGKVRLYRTRERQDFHTDGADLIGLLCLHRARSGGQSRIVSSHAIYNEMLRTRPDLIDVLYEPFWWDRQDEQAPGESPWFVLPPLNDVPPHAVDSVPRLFYIGWYLRDAQRHPEVPRLAPQQLEAMAMIEQLANDPTFHLEMDFVPGDIQLLNNGVILHAREAYEDDDDPALRRHLLRLWLAAHSFTSVADGLRSGMGSTNES